MPRHGCQAASLSLTRLACMINSRYALIQAKKTAGVLPLKSESSSATPPLGEQEALSRLKYRPLIAPCLTMR